MEARRNSYTMEVEAPSYRGAEAYLYHASLLGHRVLVKKRIGKRYRHNSLDEKLRRIRTLNEARIILATLAAGIPAPTVYYVDPEEAIIVLEYIEGKVLHDLIEEKGVNDHVLTLVEKLGYYAGVLHENNIVHGDLTTSNAIVSSTEVFLIDFGLAERSRDELDKAVDVHLFLRSLESAHPEHVEALYKAFIRGYQRARGKAKAEEVVKLVEKIRLMGRYVEERRLVWGKS